MEAVVSNGTRFGLDVAGQPNRTRGTKLSSAIRHRESYIFPVESATNRTDNHNQLMPNLLKVITTHTVVLGALIVVTTDSSQDRSILIALKDLYNRTVLRGFVHPQGDDSFDVTSLLYNMCKRLYRQRASSVYRANVAV